MNNDANILNVIACFILVVGGIISCFFSHKLNTGDRRFVFRAAIIWTCALMSWLILWSIDSFHNFKPEISIPDIITMIFSDANTAASFFFYVILTRGKKDKFFHHIKDALPLLVIPGLATGFMFTINYLSPKPVTFKITEKTIEILQKNGIKNDLIEKLYPLKDNEYVGEDKFNKELQSKLTEQDNEQIENVKQLVLKYTQNYLSPKPVTFKITEKTIEILQKNGIKNDLIEKLYPLKDNEYVGEDKFNKELQSKLTEQDNEQIENVKQLVLKHTRNSNFDVYTLLSLFYSMVAPLLVGWAIWLRFKDPLPITLSCIYSILQPPGYMYLFFAPLVKFWGLAAILLAFLKIVWGASVYYALAKEVKDTENIIRQIVSSDEVQVNQRRLAIITVITGIGLFSLYIISSNETSRELLTTIKNFIIIITGLGVIGLISFVIFSYRDPNFLLSLSNLIDMVRKQFSPKDPPEVLKKVAVTKPITSVYHDTGKTNFNGVNMVNKNSSNPIRILHLSDLHINEKDDPISNLQPLVQDITDKEDGMGYEQLDYLIITGDITNRASVTEFNNAKNFILRLSERLSIPTNKFIIVPGNHDLNWDEKVYEWNTKREVKEDSLREGNFIIKADGYLIRKDSQYTKRFKNFSNFYKEVVKEDYPLHFEEQCKPIFASDIGLQFLLMNSCWEIDEQFPNRSSINNSALSKGLSLADEQIRSEGFSSDTQILKIAVWHHPVTGNEKILNDSFLQLLHQKNVKICLHGHIHELRNDLLGYLRKNRQIHVIGAGSFGAIAEHRPESTPRLYNIIEIERDLSMIRVHTRHMQRDGGAWQGYALWPGKNKHDYHSYYEIETGLLRQSI